MAKAKNLSRFFTRRYLFTALLVSIILGLGAWLLWGRSNDNVAKPPTDTTTESGAYVNLNLPTEEEKNPARDNPTPQSSTTQAGTKKKVTPIITSADKQSVYAYVPGIVEDGGTCANLF